MFFLKRNIFVGLEITDPAIKLLKLRRSGKNFQVITQGIQPLPAGAVLNGKIKQPEIVIKQLNELVKQTKTHSCKTAIALPYHTTFAKHISLAKGFTELEIEVEINSHLKKLIPEIEDNLCFDFVKLSELNTDHIEFFIIAARNEIVESYIQLATASGLNIKKVDVNLYALVRAMNISAIANDTAYIVIDHQENFVQCIMVHHHEIIFYQQWDFVRETFIYSLKQALQLSISIHPQCIPAELYFLGEELIFNDIQKNLTMKTFLVKPPAESAANMMTALGLALRGLQYARY